MKINFKYRLLSLSLVLFASFDVSSQDDVGLPSLKIDPGTRTSGMAGVSTGIGDDAQTLYGNPGGLGHLRQWQWSVNYNRWFADMYQASFTASRLFKAFGSLKTGVGFMCNYIGMPPWDATGGSAEAVSANDLVLGVGLAQRLDWLHKMISVGVHVKFIRSRMAHFSASGIAADFGILVKPGRFRLGSLGLGIFDYGIVSVGASLSHVGGKMTFDKEGSSLPQTWRAGASILLGRYAEWSWLIASDIIGVLNRKQTVAIGNELWWKDILGFRFGYKANGKDLGDFSFGFGFRCDDILNNLLGLPSRFGNVFEIDLADAGYGDVLRQTYRGGLSHYPSAPEPFTLFDPEEARSDSSGIAAVVDLGWGNAEDPDPFDEVRYIVIVDRDKPRIAKAVRKLETDWEGFWNSATRSLSVKDSLFFCKEQSFNSCVLPVAKGGSYYWAVAAYDKGHHVRMAKKGSQKILRFLVAVPDLAVSDIVFNPIPYITTTPEQGKISVRINNSGSAACDSLLLVVEDIRGSKGGTASGALYRGVARNIPINGTVTVAFPWQTDFPGPHILRASVDPDSAVLELNEKNNALEAKFITVPKGRLSAPDSAEVMVTGYSSLEIPMVPEVYFDKDSSRVPATFYAENSIFPSLLPALAKRLKENPDVTLNVFGAIDALSGERDPGLADSRAERVKERFVQLGVSDSQIQIVTNHPNKILGRYPMPKNPQDAEWVMEQNRVVTFKVEQKDEERMFQPYLFAVDTTMRDSVKFETRIYSPSGIRSWELTGQTGMLQLDSRRATDGDSLWGSLVWRGTDRSKVVVPRNRWYRYSLILTDTLGRTFRTLSDSLYLQEKRTIQRQEIFGAAKFGKVEPVYTFYWDRVMSVAGEMIDNPGMRLRFEGHACAIGPDKVNERLSLQRAVDFTQKFLERVKAKYPQLYEDIRRRIAKPVGAGEREPLYVNLKGVGEVQLGDNNKPIGRYLNRRIAVLLYREH
jgi:outer membrane protein OmpA-like peptidoglycan-associated protein